MTRAEFWQDRERATRYQQSIASNPSHATWPTYNRMERNLKTFYYRTCCVDSDGPSINEMTAQAREVTLATIRRHCADLKEWETKMQYGPWLRLSNDFAVSYYRSTYKGKRCYYIRHSAIEHIWTEGGE